MAKKNLILETARDLTATADSRDFRLLYHHKNKRHSVRLKQGDTIVGSSSLCDITIAAPGIRSRHLRLKVGKSRIFIQPLHESKVLLGRKIIKELTPLAFGRKFKLGSISASIEKISATDKEFGVKLKPGALSSVLADAASHRATDLITTLEALMHCVESCADPAGESHSEEWLNFLVQQIHPKSVGLFKKKPGTPWSVLSEHKEEDGGEIITPDQPEGYDRFLLTTGKTTYCLLVSFYHDEDRDLRDTLCRLALLMVVHLNSGTIDKTAKESAGALGKINPTYSWRNLVGIKIKNYLQKFNNLCSFSDSILVIGETGTGKELVARGLHELWGRKGEFVGINCAAIPGDLLDAEIFGVEAGTATGVAERSGRLKQAEGGTLFLDEISEIPLELQIKLLRVLQEREYYPLGGKKLIKVNVKIVSASNLTDSSILEKKIRSDLFFRLGQAIMTLPPLRNRTNDIAALCEYFLNRLERRFKRGITGISISAIEALKAYGWPGNVRELENIMRALYSSPSPGEMIRLMHFPDNFSLSQPLESEPSNLFQAVNVFEKQHITSALEKAGSITEAAQNLGISESYLYRKIKKLSLNRQIAK